MIRVNREMQQYIEQLQKQSENRILTQKYHISDHLMKQGEHIHAVYVIKSGIAKCYLLSDNGTSFVQEFFGEGEICGEGEAIHDDFSFCFIEALTVLEVYQIKQEYFQHLLKHDQKFNDLILKSLALKIKYKAIRHAYNQSHTAEENLSRLYDSYPKLVDEISKQDIANYLGITLRSLNRILKQKGKTLSDGSR